jgi:site-specific DNA recombinase
MRAVVYTRISNDRAEDDERVQPTARQREQCLRLAEANDWVVVAQETDEGISGWSGAERPGFERVRHAVESHAVDVVIVWKLDRLARRIQVVAEFGAFLEKHNCALVTVVDGVNTAGPGGKFILHLMGLLAELESDTISLRVKSAAAASARLGKAHPGGRRPFGYEADKVTIREEEANVIRTAVDRLVNDGVPVGATLREMGRKERSAAITGYLRNPRLVGYRQHNGELHPAEWEPILTHEQWNKLQQLYGGRMVQASDGRTLYVVTETERTGRKKISVRRHLLTGLVWCGECGRPIRSDSRGHYVCEGKDVAIDAAKLEAEVVEYALMLKVGDVTVADWRDGADPTTGLADVEKKIDRLTTLYVDGAIDRAEFDERRAVLRGELAVLRLEASRLASLPMSVPEGGSRPNLDAWWEGASMEERRQLLASVIHRVTVRGDRQTRQRIKDATGAKSVDLATVQSARVTVKTVADAQWDEWKVGLR